MLSQYLIVICLIVAYTYAFCVILHCLGERWDGTRFQKSLLCISCILGGINIVLQVKPLSNNEIFEDKKKKKGRKNGTLNLSPFSQFALFFLFFCLFFCFLEPYWTMFWGNRVVWYRPLTVSPSVSLVTTKWAFFIRLPVGPHIPF